MISPLNPERKIDIAQTYLEAGNEEMAIQNFNLAVEQVKKQVGEMICGTLMKIARKAQGVRPDISSKYISMAIEQKGKLLSREDLWMIAEMGVALRQQGKWQEAISYYKRGLEVAPLSGYLYYNIGVAYLQGKEFYKALSSFQKTIEYSPEILKKQAVIPCNIAKAYIGLGRKKEAAKFLNMALKQDPDHKETKRILLTVWKKKISASRQPHQS